MNSRIRMMTVFTYDNYVGLLDQVKQRGYRFEIFPNAERLLAEQERFVLMRHDIDLSLEKAIQMATIEAEQAVAATYFFMVRTDFYNVFSAQGSRTVRRILDLGHHLALHFDCAAYTADLKEAELADACTREAQMLERWFDRPIEIVSYHRPSKLVLGGSPGLSAPYPHTYMPLYTGPITYCSDSRGQWRYGHPTTTEAFGQGSPLHILVHPVWWNDRPTGAYETLLTLVDRNKECMERSLAANCEVYRHGHSSACDE